MRDMLRCSALRGSFGTPRHWQLQTHQGTGHPHRLFSCAVPELEARGCQRGTTFHGCNWVRCHRPPHADCGRASARILECRPTLAAGETFQLLSACRLLHLAWFWRVEVAHRAAPTQREDSVRATPMPTAPLSLESIPFSGGSATAGCTLPRPASLAV